MQQQFQAQQMQQQMMIQQQKKAQIVKMVVPIVLMVVFLISAILTVSAIVFKSGQKPAEGRYSCVLIQEVYPDPTTGSVGYATGTGWAIGKPGGDVQYIITNGHVVAEAYVYGGNVQVYFSLAENDYVTAKVVAFSDANTLDMAILELPSPTDKREAMIIRDSDTVEQGDTAFALGFPAISSQASAYNRYDAEDVTVTSGVIGKRVDVGKRYDAFQMDVSISGGNSGGPLVDSKGFVIGMNTLSNTLTDTMDYAIEINYVTNFLDQNGLGSKYVMSNSRDWMLGLFLPLAILSVGGAVATFVMGNKKSAAAPAAASYVPPYGGSVPPGPVMSPAPGVSVAQPVLRGVAGKYSGQKFEMKGKLTLGRDSSVCNIVFPPDTPGVSSNHCSVYFDPNTDLFVLTDNGSSFGTFLGNGRKLAANVPEKLSVGDTFCLADTKIRFIVGKE